MGNLATISEVQRAALAKYSAKRGVYFYPSSPVFSLRYFIVYDINSARYTRIDATVPLSVAVYNETAKTNLCGNAKTNVKVSDGQAVPAEICFIQNWGGKQTTGTVTPWRMEVKNFGNGPNKVSFRVTDGKLKAKGAKADDPAWEVEFAVSDIKENTDGLAHKPDSFPVSKNNSAEATITGAEIKDTFKLTATVSGTDVTAAIPVTVNADGAAKVSSVPGQSSDESFRKDFLDYTR